MSVIYGLIPGMIVLGLVGVLVFFWAVKSGQYDDMEGPAHRILDDDDIDSNDQQQHQNRSTEHRSNKHLSNKSSPDQSSTNKQP